MGKLSCAITGHRPTRFKFKYCEDNNGCVQLKKRLKNKLYAFMKWEYTIFG